MSIDKHKDIRNTLDKALEALEIHIHVDSTKESVIVPTSLKGNPALTIKISYHFSGEVTLEEEHIAASLLFPEGRYECELPYEAIWGYTDEEEKKHIFNENVPAKLLFSLPFQAIKEKLTGKKDRAEEKKEKTEQIKKQNDKPKKSPAKLKRIK